MSGSAEDLAQRGTRGFEVLARLRGGVSLARAQAEMQAISLRLAHTYPQSGNLSELSSSQSQSRGYAIYRTHLLHVLPAHPQATGFEMGCW